LFFGSILIDGYLIAVVRNYLLLLLSLAKSSGTGNIRLLKSIADGSASSRHGTGLSWHDELGKQSLVSKHFFKNE